MTSLRAIAASLGVPYVTAYRSLWRLLGIGPRHMRRMDNPDVGIIHGGAVETVIKAALALARRNLAYYTLSPVPLWPWLLVPVKSVDALEKLLESMRRLGARPSSVILDVGIMDWFNGRTAEYSDKFWDTLWEAVDRLRELAREYGFEWRIVLPDVPATVPDNVPLTMRLQERLLSEHPELPWIPVAQASRETPHTEHLAWLVETGVVEKYGCVALGSLKLLAGRKKALWRDAVYRSRGLLEEHGLANVRLHLFGAPLDIVAAEKLPPGSWDSKTWTFPRVPYLWSAKDGSMRIVYFTTFLERLVELLVEHGGG
ncbi:hypothetical protein Pyrde_0697 [Pyrodictium delaneyi]|uniref:Uncharacterized protein n=1 Tax=Pyrodictium delaneyi TaxID=1273541 RepID=A0A0P0N322_9CREN|nr:hypothetical protein [Pyrodictium delaneyi]ALL00747.1 hypothetical protein Pyrde_0697 [Pyrodictium delaneyi]